MGEHASAYALGRCDAQTAVRSDGLFASALCERSVRRLPQAVDHRLVVENVGGALRLTKTFEVRWRAENSARALGDPLRREV